MAVRKVNHSRRIRSKKSTGTISTQTEFGSK